MEIWKTINGYENYQVSSLGRIRTKYRTLKNLNKKGYSVICLCNNNVKKYFLIHRLVALHFIPNPENKPQVNHIDGNKLNNSIINLEWNTSKENINHSWENGLSKNNSNRIKKVIESKSIRVKNIVTNEVFNSIKDASIKSNYTEKSLGYQINKSKNNKSNFIKI